MVRLNFIINKNKHNTYYSLCQYIFYLPINFKAAEDSIFTPGPIVEDTVIDLKYFPLADAGLSIIKTSMTFLKLSTNSSTSKEAFPIGRCILPSLSTLYSNLPALNSSIDSAKSNVTVPALGLGIKPLGPKILPKGPTTPIISGVAIAKSKSSQPSSILSAKSSWPTISAPASSASRAFHLLQIQRSLLLDQFRGEVLKYL